MFQAPHDNANKISGGTIGNLNYFGILFLNTSQRFSRSLRDNFEPAYALSQFADPLCYPFESLPSFRLTPYQHKGVMHCILYLDIVDILLA